ncbi:hypothetical protein [Noviherbaspirillum suwonense]|jgi:hypothetical protein|uniref:Tat pathway signal protein n=1 Tax=Noviherbaspirillum suwonense TaxID=1224511 RepID=A0ABY1QEY7_9BURK|nr:hypothetical protein [Noviherbaspirillum suwonense]SMP69439.1 hypothetical protein SAMN06295970_11524 [Noviherbaspirillum suwonense]
MTMENSGHEDKSQAADQAQPPAHAVVPNPSRRRFTRVGVGASAVVATLASRSVLANLACTTPSGFTSMNQSHRAADGVIQCNGLSYMDWMRTEGWAPPGTAMFSIEFSPARPDLLVGEPVTGTGIADTGGGTSGLLLDKATLRQALFGTQTPLIVKHLIAALLNASTNRSTYPTTIQVKEIFRDWNANNSYEVTAGVRWSTDEIIKYLSYTQTPGSPLNNS